MQKESVQKWFLSTATQFLSTEIDRFMLKRNDFPLKPACSLTIPKSQGGTFDEIVYKYFKAHSLPLVYVALSRVTAQGHMVPTNGSQRFYYGRRNNKAMLPLRN
ncbi:ATP-dependent DNA helicase [Trichonephila clavipes]|uniref:ATP-dependent DNA helicase n=1 Tax=Trichonephila clavipes TaxID=2585209 RepID=A0A8X6R9S6_TRICX|nr:ATP-dependent DNA helicase [Trichonephila clavipes]